MGTSAFDPIVLADTRSVKNKINIAGITGNVLSIGDVIRYDPSTDVYVLAKADSQVNATILGVVENITPNDMTIVYSGEVSLPDSVFSSMTGVTGAQVFYLSDTNAGKLTTTVPTNPGSIIKPVFIVSGTMQDSSPSPLGLIDGIVINTTGTTIVGDSTVDLSDVQPVGSISAFAGNMTNIPTGWDICDGGYLSTTTYSDLYNALNQGRLYGFVQDVQLQYSSGTQLDASSLVNARFYLPNGEECTILSGTFAGTTITNARVFVDPIVNDGYHTNQVSDGISVTMFTLSGGSYVATTGQYLVKQSTTLGSLNKIEFKKPDMRSRFIIGDSKNISGSQNTAFGAYTTGRLGGQELVTLSGNQMPRHTHDLSLQAQLGGNVSTSHTLATSASGSHAHYLAADIVRTTAQGTLTDVTATDYVPRETGFGGGAKEYRFYGTSTTPSVGLSSIAPSHTHTVTGNISVSTAGLTPTVTGTATDVGADEAHSNVPQHVVMVWIIKTRKDSYAKIFKLGPSAGGAVLAKNTAKRWARMSSGAGATVDASYGTWGVQRLGNGNYILTHNLINDVGTADSDKYIVNADIARPASGAGSTGVYIANTYGYTGYTFGVSIYNVIGATHSDGFGYLNLTMYSGGTAL